MNMKLSYRDKVIFVVIIVLIILAGGFFLFIRPKFKEIENAKYTLETKQQEKADVEAKIQTLDQIVADLKSAAEDIGEKQGIFLDEQHPYLNETYIREMLAKDNLKVNSIDTSYTTASDIIRYNIEKRNLLAYNNKMSADLYNELPQEIYDLYNGVPPETFDSVTIGVTTVTVAVEGGNKDVETIIDRIAADEKTIVLNTIGTEDETENNSGGTNAGLGEGLTASSEKAGEVTATITMYSIYPLNVEKVLQESTEIKPIEQPAA